MDQLKVEADQTASAKQRLIEQVARQQQEVVLVTGLRSLVGVHGLGVEGHWSEVTGLMHPICME